MGKMPTIDIHRIYSFFFSHFRKRRMKRFAATLSPTHQTKILDVGGTSYNWRIIHCESQITLLNLSPPQEESALPHNFTFLEGDGTKLAFPDGAFDIGYSNSVIEHLGTLEKQRMFASEIRRVGQCVWVQTPASSFFLETHLLTPFIHYFPKNLQKKLLRHFTLWGLITKPSQALVDGFLSELRLLTYDEMRQLFPDCRIYKEKFLGFTKAYIAIRG